MNNPNPNEKALRQKKLAPKSIDITLNGTPFHLFGPKKLSDKEKGRPLQYLPPLVLAVDRYNS